MSKSPKKTDYSRTKEFSELRKSLLDCLAAQGLDDPVWKDKIEEYMAFWILRKQLQADVASRGLVVVDERGRSSENRSVSLAIQVSRQMLSILQLLGLNPDVTLYSPASEPEDDDEL